MISRMGKQLTENFAEFIFKVRFDELPKEVVHQTKRCMLDFLGVALAGSKTGLAPLVTKIIYDSESKREATIIGDGRKVSALHAAFVNGVRGHTLDMDDGHRYANAHPGVAIIPASLAMAEKENVTGRELIEAITVGYEIFLRIATAINPSHLLKGFHTTGTVGPFGAAAACSKILNLSKIEVKNALAIAGLQGAGLLEVATSGQMMKPLHPGRAAEAGVLASLLAKEGAGGPDLIFEGDKGFLKAFSESSDLGRMVTNLGNSFEIMNIYFKLHAACRHIHPSLDAILEIMNKNKIAIDEIDGIHINTYSIAYKLTGQNDVADTELAAKFNLPVSIALALVYGKAGVDEYSIENIKNPLIQKLAKKVTIEIDKKMDESYPNKRGASVKIKTSKGFYACEMDNPRGEPEFPFSDDELNDKFIQNSKKVLPMEKINKLQEVLLNIEGNSVRTLMELAY